METYCTISLIYAAFICNWQWYFWAPRIWCTLLRLSASNESVKGWNLSKEPYHTSLFWVEEHTLSHTATDLSCTLVSQLLALSKYCGRWRVHTPHLWLKGSPCDLFWCCWKNMGFIGPLSSETHLHNPSAIWIWTWMRVFCWLERRSGINAAWDNKLMRWIRWGWFWTEFHLLFGRNRERPHCY